MHNSSVGPRPRRRRARKGLSACEISTRYAFDFDGAIPEEGFNSYIVLRRRSANGALRPVLRAELQDGIPAVSAPVEPGRYRISAYLRTCSGTCESLDPPSHGCGRDVTVSSGERVRATITVKGTAEHCRIQLR